MISRIKKELGAFYTPSHTADYMISKLDGFDEDSKLLEPCGGDGIFVSRILDKKLLDPKQITVWDINPDVKINSENLGVRLEIKDSLLQTDFKNNLFGRNNIFSHIIGNPPYLNKQSSYIKENKTRLEEFYNEIGVYDTYGMFLYLCGNLLKEQGQLSFIISDTYLTLGIHKRLRYWLLKNFTIKEITFCPDNLFKDSGASVHTSILTITKKNPDDEHFIIFNDCKKNKIGNYKGKIYKVRQNDFLDYPDFIFHFKNGKKVIMKIKNSPKMINYLDGGLGMHTTDNNKFLGIIDYGDGNFLSNGRRLKNTVPIKEIKSGKWRVYHKRGGNSKYYSRPNYAIRWDSEAISKYKGWKNLNLDEPRQGFIVSGVCSSLSARLAAENALWESNKAMCFFPKEPEKYPVHFFIGLLNSKIYNNIIRIFNHTNSIQIRDIRKLPMLDFKKNDIEEISKISERITQKIKADPIYNYKKEQDKIDLIINKYVAKKKQESEIQ